jgi:hypothetical protein
MMARGMDIRRRQWRDGSPLVLWGITFAFAALPYLIFAIERWADLLPSERAWLEQGSNHGPWRWEAEGFTIFYPLVFLLPVTFIVAVRRALQKCPVINVSLLLAAQITLLMLQAYTLYWLID